MPVTISVSEAQYIGLTTRRAEDPPIWGVIFQLNREDGIGTAIGVTVRSDDEADAREQALSKLQGFLSEALAAAQVLAPSVLTQELAQEEARGPGSQEMDEHEARAEALDEDLDAVRGEGH